MFFEKIGKEGSKIWHLGKGGVSSLGVWSVLSTKPIDIDMNTWV